VRAHSGGLSVINLEGLLTVLASFATHCFICL
jgi:hypothetical protein